MALSRLNDRVSDESVRESTQEFDSGAKAQRDTHFKLSFVVTVIKFEAEVRMYNSHITLTLTRVAFAYSTEKIISTQSFLIVTSKLTQKVVDFFKTYIPPNTYLIQKYLHFAVTFHHDHIIR